MARSLSPAFRLQADGVRIDGGIKLDFKRYPFIPEIIDGHSRYTTILKGGQMGFSIACILRALEEARTEDLRGILYLFPTDREVQDFSKSRFSTLMEQNRHVWGEDVVGNTDSAGLKEIGGSFIYFRGSGQKGGATQKSTSMLKSMPIDRIYYDERDEMDDSRVDAAEMRVTGSLHPEETSLSTPTLPGYGVDLLYQSSDQRAWHWKCERCNGWTCLELTYPDCIVEPLNGNPFYRCSKCKEELVRSFGEWVAAKPHVKDHRGFYASQLCSPTRTPTDILAAHEKAISRGRLREFYNQVLARPFAEIEDVITAEQLNALVTEEVRSLRHEGPSAMGVDPGKPHWYTVRVRVSDQDYVQIDRGRADTFEELARIAKKYNVKSGVMDQGADSTSVANFVKAHPGWWGCLYVEQKKTGADWNPREKMVKVGRTFLLDQAHQTIINKRIHYPAKDEFWEKEFVPQMTNLARTIIENPETGARTAKWVITGGQKNDHLRHADAYADLACEKVGLVASVRRLHERSQKLQRGPRRSFMAS